MLDKLNFNLKACAPAVLRYSMAMVILWFSIQQFMNANAWTAYVPDSVVSMSHLNAITLVYFNALFELVFGIMLILGYRTRLSAILLSLHLLDIMYVVGYGEIGVRDFGLAMATFVVFMNGYDNLCLDYKDKEDIISNTSEAGTVQQPKRI
ncbi:MAG: DoxX family protein [bacterium]